MGRKKKKQLKPWCWYPLSAEVEAKRGRRLVLTGTGRPGFGLWRRVSGL